MSNPNYLISIKFNDGFQCLGKQLVMIFESLTPFLNDAIWYASDVVTNDDPPFKLGLQMLTPTKIGTTSDIIKLALNVDQFQSGVFLAFMKDQGFQLSHDFDTEGEFFRDMGDAVMEIRAFDTSYFEIYTISKDITNELSDKFSELIIRFKNRESNSRNQPKDQIIKKINSQEDLDSFISSPVWRAMRLFEKASRFLLVIFLPKVEAFLHLMHYQ